MHPKKDLKNLDGKIFVLNGRLGYATYYFRFNGPYTDYSDYPNTLDNGENAGEKPFENWSYDQATRKFTADVNWEAPYQFGGKDKWTYECIFNEDFSKIVGGGITYLTTSRGGSSFCAFGPSGFDFRYHG